MPLLTLRPSKHQPWRVLLAGLCILLIVVIGSLQTIHTHPDGGVSHADCSLCATAHVVFNTTQPPIAAPPTVVQTAPEQTLPVAKADIVFPYALFTRPPPVDLVSA